MKAVFAILDCGTTSIKAAVVDSSGRFLGFASRTIRPRYLYDGGAEQDPKAMLQAAFSVLKTAMSASKTAAGKVQALCITNQRATILPLSSSGTPLTAALGWQDTRGAADIASAGRSFGQHQFYSITGVKAGPLTSLSRMLWLKRTHPSVFKKVARFVLVDGWILSGLGASDLYVDQSNASYTGLFDVKKGAWSNSLTSFTGISQSLLPEAVPAGTVAGRLSKSAARRIGLTPGTPLVLGGGDQQCAALGAGVIKPGTASLTMGTASVLCSFSKAFRLDPAGGITTQAHVLPGAFVLEGLQSAGGASIDWLCSQFPGMKSRSPASARKLSAIGPGSNGLYFFPFLNGAASPHWEPDACGVFTGLRMHHHPLDLLHAVLEGVTFENCQILEAFRQAGSKVSSLRMTGGKALFPEWPQALADIFQCELTELKNEQTTIIGAAILAGMGTGFFKSAEEGVGAMVRPVKVRGPGKNSRIYRNIYGSYVKLFQKFMKEDLFKPAAFKNHPAAGR